MLYSVIVSIDLNLVGMIFFHSACLALQDFRK